MKSGNEENCRRTGVQYSRYNFQTQQNEYTTCSVVSFFENFKRLKEQTQKCINAKTVSNTFNSACNKKKTVKRFCKMADYKQLFI